MSRPRRELAQLEPGRPQRRSWVYGRSVGDAFAACSVVLALSVVADLTDGGGDALVLAVSAAVSGLLGALFVGSYRGHRPLHRRDGYVALTLTWIVMIAVSTVVYLVIGTPDGFTHALHESVAGFTTTNSSMIVEPDQLGRGLLFWRAGTQWMGGFGALIVLISVIPTITETRDFGERTGLAQSLAPSAGSAIRNIGGVYAAVTLLIYAMYDLAGMGWFNAITHSMTTASTGGFSTSAEIDTVFDSTALIWTGAAAMTIAGLSIALVFWMIRGAVQPVLRSVELRVYLLVLIAATGLTLLINDGLAVSDAAFTVASVVTTTGFGNDLATWASAGSLVMFMLLAVGGAMGGSASGGLGISRMIALNDIARREITLELHPRAVVALKGDGRAYGRKSIDYIVDLEILTAALVMLGAAIFALFDFDVIGALSSSIAYLSTTGGPLIPLDHPSALSGAGQTSAITLMFLGRLAIIPVLVACYDTAIRVFVGYRR
ncbi:MAG: TrkH family potassium uptake protein [Acidobacteria bacterium]|nr:TrkH family potassium uptake protein [Acidobacteriota bacterium]